MLLAKIKKYIEASKQGKALEKENSEFLKMFKKSLLNLRVKRERYESLLVEHGQTKENERIIELAYAEYMVAVQELEFLLSQAKESNIIADWSSMVS